MSCQKCRGPLRVDGSLEDLNPAAYDLLVGSSCLSLLLPTQADREIASSSQHPPRNPLSARPPHPQDRHRKATYEKASQNIGPAMFKRVAPVAGAHRDSSMSFIYLTESQVTQPNPPRADPTSNPISPRSAQGDAPGGKESPRGGGLPSGFGLERVNKLFEMLSARSDVDHPICVECTEMLVEGLQKKLESSARERDAYVGFLKQAQANQPRAEDVEAGEQARENAQRQETDAMQELLDLEKEKAEVDREILALEDEARELDLKEEEFWRERNAFTAKLSDFQNERDSLNSKYDHDSRLLEKLQRSNVYNDTFCISHDGTFATINGLRLGRLSNKPVDWPEINAAWGHALLLLVTVAEKLDYRFDGFEPEPMGSTSRIVRFELPSPTASRLGGVGGQRNGPPPAPKRHVLELYSAGDLPLGLTFMHRKFDNAMVAFLELVRQLGAFVHRQTAAEGHALTLPYKIEGDWIHDVSIKLGIAQDDGWTKACKLTLTCCKFLLAHASNVSSSTKVAGP